MGFSSEMELLGRPVGPAVKPHDFTFQIMDCLWEVPVLEGEEEEIPLDGSESTSKGLNVSFERSYYNFKVNVRNQQQSVLGNFSVVDGDTETTTLKDTVLSLSRVSVVIDANSIVCVCFIRYNK